MKKVFYSCFLAVLFSACNGFADQAENSPYYVPQGAAPEHPVLDTTPPPEFKPQPQKLPPQRSGQKQVQTQGQQGYTQSQMQQLQNQGLQQIGPEVYEENSPTGFYIEGNQDLNEGNDYLDRDHPLQEAPLQEGMVK
jgi:hypothetical protein